ncbi:MAG: MFS transporter [Anaerolineales bacterium]|nr:MFS transporter [Anaerolineales bacterium]
MAAIRRLLTPSYEGNIPRFFIYRILYNFMLFLPVWVIYMQDKFNLSLTEVTLNDSAFWLTMALTEVPTGVVADTWGRKQSQLIGMLIATGAILLFALAPVYSLVLLGNSLWAFGITFISGADLAFFYDTLQVLGREHEYPRYRGQLQAYVLVSIALSSVLGGLIGEISLVSTFTITAAVMLLATVLVLGLKEPPRQSDPETGSSLNYRQILGTTLRAIRREPGLRYALLYSSILPLVLGTIQVTFIQPHVIAIGLPIAALGFISLGLRLAQFGGALNAGRIIQRLGEWNWLGLAPLLIFSGVIALGVFNSMLGIVFFAVTGFASAVTTPLLERIVLRQSPAAIRATILSVDSLLNRFFLALLGPAIGLLADGVGLAQAFIWVGLGLGCLILVIRFYWRRVWGTRHLPTTPA